MELRPLLMLAVTVTLTFSGVKSDVNVNASDFRCPDNQRYDAASRSCVQICLGDDSDNVTLCKPSPIVTYEVVTSKNVPKVYEINFDVSEANVDEPIVTLSLPSCKTVTLNGTEIKSVTEDGVTVSVGKIGPVTVDKYQLSADNASVTLCYPLSPQLLQCKLKRLNIDNYVTLPSRTLQNVLTNETIGFRDYYTNVKNADVIGCTEPINESRKLRCNYVTYNGDEYRLSADKTTIHLLPTNETIYRPIFTQVENSSNSTDAITLCYPMTPNFTMCPKLWFLEKYEFEFNADHRMRSFAHHRTYELGDFFIFPDKRAVVCAQFVSPPKFDFIFVHACLYVVSAICLLVAFVVHLVVPSLNYHAKPLLCHMLSMLVLYISLATRKFMTGIKPAPCYILFITTYTSALASFFWLSVLAFDLWSIFANLQTSSRLGCRPWACGSKNKRFWYYSAYAWGIPVALCALAVILDTNVSLQEALHIYTNVSNLCWFNNRKSAYLLLYAPLFTILAINSTLFVLTVANLRMASRGAEVVNKKLNQQLLFVCVRLFIVMGLCWIVEAVTWTLQLDEATLYIPDIVIAIQGIVIFIIYICKPTTYRLLRRKFSSDRQRSTDTRWTTDSSKGHVERKTSTSCIFVNTFSKSNNVQMTTQNDNKTPD